MPGIEGLLAAVLDTHVWLWVCAGHSRARVLTNFTGRAVVSAISVWEIAMLESKGRITLKPNPQSWLEKNLRAPVELEPIHPAICLESCRLPDFHGDPADRLVVATALVLGVPLVTADEKILTWNEEHRLLRMVAL